MSTLLFSMILFCKLRLNQDIQFNGLQLFLQVMLTVSIGSTQVINSMSNYYLIDFDLRDSDSGHYKFEELVEHINRLKTAEITLRMISISVVSVLIVMLYKSLDHFNPIQTDEEPNVENLLTNNDNSIMSFDR